MKVIKISDTSIEFVLTSKDLIDKNINIDKLSTEDIYTQYVVTDLIEEAELKHNITIVNRSLLSSIITKIDNKVELNFDNINKFDDDEYEKRIDLRFKLRRLFDNELKYTKN